MLKLNMYFGFLLQLATCSFLGVDGELTHIQEFVQLSDNVGMLYLLTKVFLALNPIEPRQPWMLQALTCLISVNPRGLSAYLRMECPRHS